MSKDKLTKEQVLILEDRKEFLEKELTRLDQALEVGKALIDLSKDDRFKLVFDEYLFKTEAIRHTMLLSEEALLDEKNRNSLKDALIGISYLNSWIRSNKSLLATHSMNKANIEKQIADIDKEL